MSQDKEAEQIGMKIGLSLLQGAFVELAAAFARHDAAAAQEAIGLLEQGLTKRLATYRHTMPDGQQDPRPLSYAAAGLRQTMRLARQRVVFGEAPH